MPRSLDLAMDPKALKERVPGSIRRVTDAIAAAGGRAMIVGGWVRDHLLDIDSKDIDIEVFGLALEDLQRVLGDFGEVIEVGRSFGILRVKGLDVDFSLPRRDSKSTSGGEDLATGLEPGLDFAAAARRRDLTINSMALDPTRGELVDPHGGREDLAAGTLRATDARHFAEDPLRGLRVAQFAARFGMEPDAELVELCSRLDLGELPGERLLEELRKLLLKGKKPSLGFEVLRRTGLLRFFPELAAMIDVPQDTRWHPEGDVWIHTMMVLDEAAILRDGGEDDLTLMFAALCHDLGKPETTRQEEGAIKSPRHETKGLKQVESLLGRLRAPHELLSKVKVLVEHHLAPVLFVRNGAKPKAYRRLARKLNEASLSMEFLVRLARADHLGRTTEDARARRFPAGDAFLREASRLSVEKKGTADVVLGRHLIARGLEPGTAFREILAACQEVQDETGWSDPDRILDRVLAGADGSGSGS